MENFLGLSSLEKFLSSHPDSIVFAPLATRYLEQGNLNKALEIAERGVEKHPDYAFGHFIVGLCYYHLKDFHQAKTHLEIALGYDEKIPFAWKLLGEINDHFGLPMQSEECYLKYYLLDNLNPEAVEKYQHEEELDFESFGQETSRQTSEDTDETITESPAKETDLDSLFDMGQEERSDEEQVSREVDEVFRETLGGIPFDEETAEDQPKEAAPEESEFNFGDEFTQMDEKKPEEDVFSFEDRDESAPGETEPPEGFSFPEEGQPTVSRESEETSGPEEKPAPDIEEQAASEPESEKNMVFDEDREFTELDDSFLDYSSVVEDIISEREDLDEKEPPEDKPGTTMTVLREDETGETGESGETNEDTPVESASSEESGETDEGATHFGRPPILSPTLGEIYIAQGRFDEAIDVFKQLLAKDPDNPRYQRKIKDIQAIVEKNKSED